MKREVACALFGLALASWADGAEAFCGFYVAKADTGLFNRASKVVLARDGDRTVMTMANDFKGAPTEFAVVIPVPTFIRRDQIKVAERAVLDHVDVYTSPRLVEYFDEDPCEVRRSDMFGAIGGVMPMAAPPLQFTSAQRPRRNGRSRYTVGEYDIVILSALQSDGLETWLARPAIASRRARRVSSAATSSSGCGSSSRR